MRVRAIHLRLLATAAALLWGAAAVAIIVAYRPGAPVAPLVAAAPIVGMGASLLAMVWPPVSRGHRASAAVSWIGILELLLLAPSVLALVAGLRQATARPFLPSAEDAYGWFLALGAASLFAGLGLSRRVLGATSQRQARAALAVLVAIALLAVGTGISGVAALGTEIAFSAAAQPAGALASAAPALPPACSQLPDAPPAAGVSLEAEASSDGKMIGAVSLYGTRVGDDERWAASVSGWPVSSGHEPASLAYVRVGTSAWLRLGQAPWNRVSVLEELAPYVEVGATPAPLVVQDRATLDTEVIRVALAGSSRLAAEDVGIELVGGVRARHCRLLAGGSIALQAFRPLRWLLGQPPLSDATAISDWRGSLDWWVLPDAELALASVSVEGLNPGWPGGLQATLQATLTVHPLASPAQITPP
ncbi:MAG: hypothetical protein ACP5VP_08675 [Candidatus Limnocylindrales bacterium]